MAMKWQDCFNAQQDIAINGQSFRVYTAGSGKTTVLLLHGAGHSALTWCLLTKLLKATYRVVALDLRGHGHTSTTDDTDLSKETLVSDILLVVDFLHQNFIVDNGSAEEFELALVGHSLGGALAVHCAEELPEAIRLVGVVMIDMVEGTALLALEGLPQYLESRPSRYFGPQHFERTNSLCPAGKYAMQCRVLVAVLG